MSTPVLLSLLCSLQFIVTSLQKVRLFNSKDETLETDEKLKHAVIHKFKVAGMTYLDLFGCHLSDPSPDHVPSRLKQTVPSALRFGFIWPVQVWEQKNTLGG